MKKGQPIKNTWGSFIKTRTTVVPKGYSNAEEVARKCNLSTVAARYKLRKLRLEGQIKSIQVVNNEGKDTWYYKD